MSLSPDKQVISTSNSKPHDGAYAGWGLIIGGAIGALPAFIWGGRMYAVAALIATTGWIVGALIDRAKR